MREFYDIKSKLSHILILNDARLHLHDDGATLEGVKELPDHLVGLHLGRHWVSLWGRGLKTLDLLDELLVLGVSYRELS